MATKLGLYKSALRLIGPHELATVTDDRPERYHLDDAYDESVAHVLQQGLWNHAIRSATLTESGSPISGWQYAFSQPSDYVRTVGISYEPTFMQGFEEYQYQAGKWYANWDTLYLSYVSNDATYGLDLTKWPQSFTDAVAAYLAFQVCIPISGERSNRNDLYNLFKQRLSRAKTLDAVDEAVKEPPPGRLVRARLASRSSKNGN